MGQLFVIASPIGNLGDASTRLVDTLRTCRAIACENPAHSRKLLSHLGVSVELVSCSGHRSGQCIPRVLDLLAKGADIGYLSDAGTPGVSDPGAALVRAVREAGHEVSPIPGPSAVTALLSVSGIAGRGWFFEGFLPPKGAKRETRLAQLRDRDEAFVLYESPHRVARLADELTRVCPDWMMVVGRELTKMHEQIVTGTVAEIAGRIVDQSIPARGEFAILVWPGKSR